MNKKIVIVAIIAIIAIWGVAIGSNYDDFQRSLIALGQHPEVPVGIGGYVLQQDGSPVPDGIIVSARSVDLDIYANGTTDCGTGVYAIGMTGRTGDLIEVICTYQGVNGCNSIYVDTSMVTQWCNITIGQCPSERGVGFPWLILMLMTGGIIGCAAIVDKTSKTESP